LPELLLLTLTFAKIGALTFGGGYAMLPLLTREVVEKRAWLTADEFADCVGIAQVTPGIIAVNMATFVGYKRRGTPGGIAATLGVMLPSVIIITVLASLLRGYSDVPAVGHAFAGIRAVVVALIAKTVFSMRKSALSDVAAFIIFAAVLAASLLLDLPPAVIALAAVAFGILRGALRKRAK
jgi:chromate transporter